MSKLDGWLKYISAISRHVIGLPWETDALTLSLFVDSRKNVLTLALVGD